MQGFKIETNSDAWDGFIKDVTAFNEKYPQHAARLRDRFVAYGESMIEWRRDLERRYPDIVLLVMPAGGAVRAFQNMKRHWDIRDCSVNERLYDTWQRAAK